ncbi:MAG: signal peptide peptidase SppA [Phycisphaerae bacterium]|nr:signal peptide peptidase SppA [Phycisphaerae bacterium]
MLKKLLVVSLLFSLIVMVGCSLPDTFLIKTVSADLELKETTVGGNRGWFVSDKIAIINIDGEIFNGTPGGGLLGGTGENPVSAFKEKLDKAAADSAVKAVVLRINSPGGSVTASDMMYNMLINFRQETGKPVVACMLDLAASGGYYIACGCDYIISGPTTITGSIGTIMQSFTIQGTMQMLGVKSVTIKSGNMKDAGSPFRDMQENEKEYLQTIIMNYYERFLGVVKAGRPKLSEDKIRLLADGRVYIGNQALKLGLVDALGYPEDAVRWAFNKAQLKKAKVIMYHRPFETPSSYYGTSMKAANPSASMVNVINVDLPRWMKGQTPGFMYLWSPELE